MTKVEIIRGTNPSISVKLKGLVLAPVFDETVDSETVTRHSYFTIRHNPGQGTLDPDKGELQIEMDSTGHVTDDMANDFYISNITEDGEAVGIAKVELSRTYTKTLHDHEYLFQFNLIDDDHNMFPVPEKPMLLIVSPNVVDLTGDEA